MEQFYDQHAPRGRQGGLPEALEEHFHASITRPAGTPSVMPPTLASHVYYSDDPVKHNDTPYVLSAANVRRTYTIP